MILKCPHCGNLLTWKSRFCQSCGQRLEVTCPNCKNPVNVVDRFCQWCGISLDSLKSSASMNQDALSQANESYSNVLSPSNDAIHVSRPMQ